MMDNAHLVRKLGEAPDLPVLDPHACSALSRLYAWAPIIPFTLRERPVHLCLRHRDTLHAPGAAYAFRAGAHRGWVLLDERALAFLLGEPHAALLPHELRAILLADALQPLVERATAALGTPFEWLPGTGMCSPTTNALCFELCGSEGEVCAQGSLAFDDSASWAHVGMQVPTLHPSDLPPALHDLPVPLRLEIGHVALRLGELRSITRGDIVAIEPWSMQGATLGVHAYVGRQVRPAFRAEVRGTTLTVLPFQDAMMMKTSPSPTNKPASGDALDPALESLEGLEVSVRFEAGQLQLPLRELGLVRAGHVFDLGQPLTQSVVRIVAHGSVVGKGQLVAIGERLGVRVAEFAAGDF